MVVADDAVRVGRQVAGSLGLRGRVVDGHLHRHRERRVVHPGRRADGPDRPENVRVPDRADNAGRLDIDIVRSTGTARRP